VTVEGKPEEGPGLLDVLNFDVLFGMIGGLLGARIVLGLRRSSQKSSS
jgi:hypothetical protein